jgi:hypothetical protein
VRKFAAAKRKLIDRNRTVFEMFVLYRHILARGIIARRVSTEKIGKNSESVNIPSRKTSSIGEIG